MSPARTFGQKLAAGFAVLVVLVLLMSASAVYSLRATVAGKDKVLNVNAQLIQDALELERNAWQTMSWVRGYLINPEPRFIEQIRDAKGEFTRTVARIKELARSEEERRLVDEIVQAMERYRSASDQVIEAAQAKLSPETLRALVNEKLRPPRELLEARLDAFEDLERRHLELGKTQATEGANTAVNLVVLLALLGTLFAIVIAAVLTRALTRQIGAAVGHVQSSSAELQAAASQQVSGAKEQTGAMTEISTTIGELVATSRQIAESAQRVADIAEQTALAARQGDGTVERGQEAIAGIRRQVDLVVEHMLDLGRKSQEIGAVLDIVSELAEQTNILAINATIEASGAGDAGRRFAVVADEIRKLADRVAVATKSIRGQIDEVRGAVNTTVMATESGAKAVDAGARQFSEVAAAFRQIAELVGTTTDAAREIELSTKQQASAAEQVRIAVSDVAQTTRETESSSSQTLQTASQLAGLSLELRRLIQPQAA